MTRVYVWCLIVVSLFFFFSLFLYVFYFFFAVILSSSTSCLHLSLYCVLKFLSFPPRHFFFQFIFCFPLSPSGTPFHPLPWLFFLPLPFELSLLECSSYHYILYIFSPLILFFNYTLHSPTNFPPSLTLSNVLWIFVFLTFFHLPTYFSSYIPSPTSLFLFPNALSSSPAEYAAVGYMGKRIQMRRTRVLAIQKLAEQRKQQVDHSHTSHDHPDHAPKTTVSTTPRWHDSAHSHTLTHSLTHIYTRITPPVIRYHSLIHRHWVSGLDFLLSYSLSPPPPPHPPPYSPPLITKPTQSPHS